MAEATEAAATVYTSVKMAYIGLAVGKDNKRFQLWLPVTDEEIDSGEISAEDALTDVCSNRRIRVYEKLVKAVGRPGVIYSFDQEEGTTVLVKGGVFIGQWKNDSQRLRWQVQHDALREQLDLLAKANKAGMRNILYEKLEPIREEFKALPTSQQSLFLARVIEFVTRGGEL